nr:non-ribosomal peptide synthetase [Pseudomonas sp. RIT623]
MHDNFFELGGDSIISIQVVSRARQAGIRFTPKDLFEQQTVQQLAGGARVGEAALAIDQSPLQGDTPLLPFQQVFFDTEIPERHHWNQSVLLKAGETLQAELLEQALQALVRHHDALRLSFVEQAEGWQARFLDQDAVQALWQREPLLWRATANDEHTLQAIGDEAQRSLDLGQGRLVRGVLVDCAEGEQRLLLVIHHLAVDGVSWRILLEDLQRAYQALVDGQATVLPAKTSSVRKWAERLQGYARDERRQAELQFWQTQLQGLATALPLDRAGSLARRHARTVHTQLDPVVTRQLLQQAPAAYRTQVNDLLLSALAQVIAGWTGNNAVLVQLEGHGREALFDDIDLVRSVGWFTSLYPARLDAHAEIGATIKQVKEQLRAIPDKGLGYSALRHLGDPASRAALAALPEAGITFNYLGQFDAGGDADQPALLALCAGAKGDEQDLEAPLGNSLTLNGQVFDGVFSMAWTFSAEQFDDATVQALADAYGAQLQAMVAHCLAAEHGGVTPSDFPLAALTQAQLDELPIAAAHIEDIYALAPMQRGMLFHTLYEAEGGDYLNQMSLAVDGLDPQRFRAAWQATLDEHEVLRSSFVWEGLDEPVQVVHKHLALPFQCLDWRGRDDQQAALEALAHAELTQGFELGAAPLLRVLLVQLDDTCYQLIQTHHHILMDGWSHSQLMAEVLQRYNGNTLPARVGRYRDYIAWLQRQDAAKAEGFWRGQLALLEEPTRLVQAMANLRAKDAPTQGHGELVRLLDAQQTAALAGFARQQKVTVNTVVQAAWLLLLQRQTGQDAVAFGATVAGRSAEVRGAEQQVGLFINTLPVVAAPLPEQRVGQWLQQVQAQNLALREFEHTPLFEVQRWSGHGAESLFDTLMVFENYPVAEALEQEAPAGLSFSGIDNHEQTNYPLTLSVTLGASLHLHFSYTHAAFSAAMTAQLANRLVKLLASMQDDADAPLSELAWLEADESRRLVHDWSTAAFDCPSDEPVHVLFEAQAARTPEAPALLFEDRQLSYRALNEQANQLARKLVEQGVGPDVLVGIAADRGLEMIVGLLAVLKAGGGYVPLDPSYPQDRLLCMIEDSRIALLLGHAEVVGRLAVPDSLPRLLLDQPQHWARYATDNLVNRVHGEHLAYVMFTSGSTGRPKGVGISQRALTRHAFVSVGFFGLSAEDRGLQFSTFNFDGFVEQLYPPLICGASVVLRGNEIWDSETFYRELIDKDISVVDLTTAYWNMLAKDFAAQAPRAYGRLRQVHSGGEAMPVEGLAAWQAAGLGHVRLLNTYGPTEATVTVSTLDCSDYVNGREPLPLTLSIGRALPGRSLYLLDDHGQPAAVGVVGELMIGGELLARGYFGRPGLTAERFLPDPFAVDGGRLYRTGDLVRYREDGLIDYIGRVDHQVKIRGFRIELGEIEARLVEHPQVHEAVVVARKAASGHQLVGYYVARDQAQGADTALLRESLREHLKALLPDYMVPAYLVALPRLPLSPNGKLDRKALPEVDTSELQQAYEAPRDALQATLATIWQDVLHLERVGISDNFFELGGDSIVSIQVVSRARRAGIVFTPKQLFEQQTIAALAAVASHDGGDPARQQEALSGALPALPVLADAGAQWMQWRVPATLDRARLEQALVALVGHHDSLRVRVAVEGNEYLPLEALQTAWQAQPLLIDGDAQAAQRQVLAEGLAPTAGILLRAALGPVIEGQRNLLLVGAGEVLDSHSWTLLGQDLQALCEQRVLPAKTHSLRHWLAQRPASSHVQGPVAPCLTALAQTTAQPGTFSLDERLPVNLGQPLLGLAPAAYRSDAGELLLTALVLCLGADSELPSIAVAAQTGRLVATCDLTRSVGPFAGRQVLHLPLASDLASAIKAVKEGVRGGQAGAQPLPAIAFTYATRPASTADAWPVLGQGLVNAPAGLHLQVTQQDERLHLHWTLEGCYQAADLQRLAARYQAQLQRLVEHCLDPHNQGVTPSDFPLAALTQRDLDQLPVAAVDIEDIYPLSPMQEGMLFHSVSDDDGELYINQSSMSIDGLDVPRLRQAWMFVTERHAVQRSSFHWQAGLSKPLQVVHRHVELDLRELDWRDAAVDEQRLAELAREERERGFELSSAPLHRVLLVRLSETRHQMIWTSHHILMDGWSSSRLFAEVLQHYAGQALPEQVGHYRDFIAWLVNQDRVALEQFWRERLRPLEEPTLLSQAVHPRHEVALSGHQALYSHWDSARTAQLQQRCRDLRITLNTLVQAAWLLVLQRYTGQTTLAFGATVAGRPESLPGADSMLGLFINTLPVIQTLEPTQPLEQWLHALQHYNLDIRDYSQAPLADVQRWAGLGAQGLFDSIIVFENYPIDERLNEEIDTGLSFGASASQGLTNFPMDLAVSLSDRLTIEYMYLRNSFAAEAVEGIRACMEQTLDALLEAPADLALGNLPRLATAQQQALQGWSAAPQASHQALDLPQLIAHHAERQPQAIAVQCGQASLDYATLEQRANRLAHALQAQGAGQERVVGVAMQRSPELLVALLAVFKSGAAYVPLDIDYPPERLAYMIEDSGMSLLLTEQALRARFDLPATLAVLEVDRCDTHAYPAQAPSSGIREHSLAYLIYTSGSTGRPKGVAVAHGPISAHCQAIVELYEMDAHSRELHFMSFAFDGAHERWLSTLLAGGTLVLRDNELWTPEQTCAALHRHGITIACFPPAYLKQLAEFVQASAEPAPPVRIYCFGGDAVPEQTYEQVKAALKPRYFTNGYGPTETVVTPMLWKADSMERCAAAYAPIGRAVGPRALYVLDDDLRPLPAGFAGELYIGGYGVARGYHRRPDASAERFVPNPFSADGDRLYRTGDLVRLRADGIIDYVGRIDHQVKIRGFRIELGEIEARLRQQAQVDDALVIARESPSGKQLIGYVVSAAGEGLGNELKAALRQVLPEYMVPAQIVCLARFPLTPNGKIDRRGLPEPQFEAARYVAPRNPREQWLAQIWEDVLQVEQVGITDNFFELGGDSILSLQVISRVRNHPTLEMDLKLRDLMRHQSIEALFDQGAAQRRGPQQDLTQLAGEGLFNLIPIQQWFFDQQMEAPHHFNQSLMLRASQPLDGVALEKALLQVVRHHDSLRLRFRQENGRWYQYYDTLAGSCEWIWHRDVADAQALNELVNAAQRSLDLVDGPVIRVVHAQMADGESRLMIAIHHLVIDGVSWRILLQDLQQAYAACAAGDEAVLPIRTSSFRSWAESLQGEAPNLAANELDYWLAQLDQTSTELPCDNPRGRNEMQFEASAQIKLSERETARLLKEVPAVYQTQINDILLTALSRVLCRWSEAESVLLQFEGHGREDLFEALDLSRTLGWFTSMYPLRLQPGLGADFGSSIKAVRQQLAQVPNKGLGYGILRHMAAPEIAERFAGLPEARVTFNYMGQFDQTFEEDGLLSPASESSGAQFAPRAPMSNWLEVTGQVYDGQMSLLCFYSTRRYRASTVEALMEAFREELLHMIEHCLAHTTPA